MLSATLAAALALAAGPLQLESPDVQDGKPLRPAQVYSGYGCAGGNASPALAWRGAPEGTRSLAVTVFDPDAPGGGFWHWILYDLPTDTAGLPAGVRALPAGARQGRNDFGLVAYSGACPPPGDRPHRYVFTLYALKVARLEVPPDAPPARLGAALAANALARASLTATYGR